MKPLKTTITIELNHSDDDPLETVDRALIDTLEVFKTEGAAGSHALFNENLEKVGVLRVKIEH